MKETQPLKHGADDISSSSGLKGVDKNSGYFKCLLPLLDALDWQGTDRDFVEAFPEGVDSLGKDDFLSVMANLSYTSHQLKTRMSRIDLRLLPCLFITKNRGPIIIVKPLEESYLIFDGEKGRFTTVSISSLKGQLIYFSTLSQSTAALTQPQKFWFWKVINRFKNLLIIAGVLSLILSIFSFISPMFVMAIYDQVLTAEGTDMLKYLGVGILVFLAGDISFRLLRSHLFNFISVRLGNISGNEILRRILYLPSEFTESASTGSQLSKIRDFDAIQSFFGGTPVTALYDLPFTLLLVVGLVFIGGNLALIPIISIVAFIIFFLVTKPFMVRAVDEASAAGSKRHEFIIDFLTSFKAAKLSGNDQLWIDRYREISAEAVFKSYGINQINTIINTGTQFLVNITGLATMTVGIFKVFNGTMTPGALMASILLVWRVLAPLRNGFGVLNQLGKIQRSIQQVNRLMSMELEKKQESDTVFRKPIDGSVIFYQISMRYSPEASPALLGINFDIRKGETLVITGPDGTGKTTILKMLLGLFKPQAGRIVIGGINVRQIDPIDLRRNIAYVAQDADIFDGSISANLLLAKPEAKEEELVSAAKQADVLEEILALKNGFETIVAADEFEQNSVFIKKLGLARLFLQTAPLYLVDEPEKGLDQSSIPHLMASLESLKSNSNLIIVTKDREIMNLADKVLWLENNRIKQYGAVDEVLKNYDVQ